MKKDEAMKEILSIWKNQPDKCSKAPMYPLKFYEFLKKNHSYLLDFKHHGDVYQVIQGWVNAWQETYCEQL